MSSHSIVTGNRKRPDRETSFQSIIQIATFAVLEAITIRGRGDLFRRRARAVGDRHLQQPRCKYHYNQESLVSAPGVRMESSRMRLYKISLTGQIFDSRHPTRCLHGPKPQFALCKMTEFQSATQEARLNLREAIRIWRNVKLLRNNTWPEFIDGDSRARPISGPTGRNGKRQDEAIQDFFILPEIQLQAPTHRRRGPECMLSVAKGSKGPTAKTHSRARHGG